VVSTEETNWRSTARNAVQSLHQAVRTLRQHILQPRLGQAAVLRCVAAVQAATGTGPLQLRLEGGIVATHDEELLRYSVGDVPFGSLAAAGIGELTLPAQFDPHSIERLVQLLAEASCSGDAEHDVVACLRAAELPGVLFRAAVSSDTEGPDEGPRADWWMLPEKAPSTALQPLIERDGFANLPAQAARLLLADLDDSHRKRPIGHLLDPLLTALLQRGDSANAAFLLERALAHADVAPAIAEQLRARAAAACHGDWLREQLEQPDRIQGLVALAMQLGDQTVQHLADVAAEAAQTLPAWFREFVPKSHRG